MGSDNAINDFLLFTDADCIPHPEWLLSYNKYISGKTGLIVGLVHEKTKSKFKCFSNYVKYGLFSSTIGLNLPFSASGGNLLIRKQTFSEIDGYEKIKHFKAGDDKLILNLVRKTEWQISYNPEFPIITYSPISPKELRDQKKRRFGKFSMSSSGYKIISVIVLAFYIYLPLILIISGNWQNFIVYYSSVFFFWIMNMIKHRSRFDPLYLFFLIIYPYYLIYYSVIGTFSKWDWKD